MTLQEEIAAIQARITKAQSERDTWRSSGMQEKYLEAYSLVEALELELERLRQEGLRTFARNHVPDAPRERERLMAEFSIAYDGRQYQYRGYRYDYLADAVNYAILQPSTASGSDAPGPMAPAQAVEAPDESQRRLMAELAITFEDGVYHLRGYRYDRLADAVSYARLQPLEGSQAMRHTTRNR
jgi:hypothetical protein